MNPYDVLGLDGDETPEEINKAYRKAARKAHPDHNPGDPEAPERFHMVQLALAVLTDPVRRKHFDETGEVEDVPTADNPEKWFAQIVYQPLIETIAEVAKAEGTVRHENIIERLVDRLDNDLDEPLQKRREMKTAIAALEDAIGRFKTKEEHNLLKSMVQDNLNEAKQELEEVEKEIADHYRAIERLKNYSYDWEPEVVQAPPGGFGFDIFNVKWQPLSLGGFSSKPPEPPPDGEETPTPPKKRRKKQ